MKIQLHCELCKGLTNKVTNINYQIFDTDKRMLSINSYKIKLCDNCLKEIHSLDKGDKNKWNHHS